MFPSIFLLLSWCCLNLRFLLHLNFLGGGGSGGVHTGRPCGVTPSQAVFVEHRAVDDLQVFLRQLSSGAAHGVAALCKRD